MRRLLIIGLLAALVAAVPAAAKRLPTAHESTAIHAAFAAGRTTSPYISNCGKLVRRPAALVLACADANYSLGALRWSDWGNTIAGAAGHASVNDCNPNCAAGHMHDYNVRVAADKLTKCSGRWIYLRVTVRYLGAPPDGVPALDVHTFTCAQALRR